MAEFSIEKRGNFPGTGVADRWYLRRIADGNVQIRIADASGNLVALDYALLSTQIIPGTGLSGGGDLSANRTLNFDVSFGDDRYVRRTGNTVISGVKTFDGNQVTIQGASPRFRLNDTSAEGADYYFMNNAGFFFISRGSPSTSDTRLRLTETGLGIGTNFSPSEKLDIDGRARFRTIDNASGDFLTASTTGVVQKRTAAQALIDLGAVPTSRTISAGTGLSGGGALSTNRSLSFDTSWGDSRYALASSLIAQSSGTYTPSLKATITDPTHSVSSTAGKWQRVGNLMKVHARVTWSSKSGGSGDVYLTLPSLSGSDEYDTDSIGVVGYRGIDLAANVSDVVADAISSDDGVALLCSFDNSTTNTYIDASALNSFGSITIDITLRIIQVV